MNDSEPEKEINLKKQMSLYLFFALLMILLNLIIQLSNEFFLSGYICSTIGNVNIINTFYCSTEPFDMREFGGQVLAVGITYITKFFLDKFFVFKKNVVKVKETTTEFFKYFMFAILTTIENLGIQFILSNFLNFPLVLSAIIALSIGYTTKFFLDRKYVFI
ncbi:MAG: GtrA-like protein [Promethearchaeota archaeon]|nr:MAG: GtrA-like protein [Candidatus Lokiarchaeota archaeon]